jgi:16S rRNA (guanine966-N2)-methyltransferase
MRIVAGSAKGTRLAPVPDGVRPLSDRAREGLFSSLGPGRVEGVAVLDLYAGTGAMGIEALSRGAERATFVERSSQAVVAIHRNLELAHVGAEGVEVDDALRFLRRNDKIGAPYRLVFADPPYDLGSPELDDVLQELASGWVANDDPTVVLTRGERSSMPVIPVHWAVARQLRYGDSLVNLIRPQDQP